MEGTGGTPVTVDYQDIDLNGIRVEVYGKPSDLTPLLFVHGGCQGSWTWEKMAPRIAENGWYAVCLNWFGHNGSAPLEVSAALSRSLLDVTSEIAAVCHWLERQPVLVAHSMGCVPSLAHASGHPVAGLVLLAPVLPAGFGAESIELPVDPSVMWMPPPSMINATWWDEVSAEEADRYTSLLSPESPTTVLEGTRWLCEVDTSRIIAPALVFAAGNDLLRPESVHALARAIGATFVTLENAGHGIPLNPVWSDVTAQIDVWLKTLPSRQRGRLL